MSKQLIRAAGWLLFDDIANISAEETNDSYSKLWNLPDEYVDVFMNIAEAFCLLSYRPYIKEVTDECNQLKIHYLQGFIFGYHVYVKERSYRSHRASFTYTLDPDEIHKVTKKTFSLFKENLDTLTVSDPGFEALLFAFKEFKRNVDLDAVEIRGHRLRRMMFRTLSGFSYQMGYVFAHRLLIPQIPLDNDWPKRALGKSYS